MKNNTELNDKIKIVIMEAEDILNNRAMMGKYMNAWEAAFERSGYRKRIEWLFESKAYVALAINTIDEIIGGLNKHKQPIDDYWLFNNLFSVKGKSSKPLSVPLIKTLIEGEKNLCIGFPNEKARTPYRRAGFKKNENYIRATIDTKEINDNDLSYSIKKIEKNRLQRDIYNDLLGSRNKTLHYLWRYQNNWKGKKYYMLSMKNERFNRDTPFIIFSKFEELRRLHIMHLRYNSIREAKELIDGVCTYGRKIAYVSVDIIINEVSENKILRNLQVASKEHPIIVYNGSESRKSLIIRDGDNDVY